MASSPHRIRRQLWLVSASTTEHAFTLRKQFRECWEDKLLPVFENVFDKLSDDDHILHIPRLEIKLKVGHNSELWESLPKELYEQLNKQLQPTAAKETEHGGDTGSWSIIPEPQHKFEVLIHYLKQGNLPWQLSILSTRESSRELRETIQNQWPQLLVYLCSNSFYESSFFRLFQLLSVEQSIKLVNDLSGNLSPIWKDDLKNVLVGLFNSGESFFNQHTRLSVAASFLATRLMKEDYNLVPDLMTLANRMLSREKKIDFQHFIAALPNHSSLFHSKEENQTPDIMPVEGDNEQLPDFMPVIGKKTQSPGIMAIEGKEELSPAVRAVDNKPEFPDEYSDFVESPDMFRHIPLNNLQNTPRLKVQYAGLVLLHPFLHRFFVHTGILEDQEKDIPFFELPRAAALLHYLATGSNEIYEFELGFIKLLLGMDTEQSLPVSEGLITQHDKEEAELLLQSVISHWSILKNTSIDGLRTSFLQRNALLHKTEEGQMLQMETSPFDMLIKQLPWSFTIIKLPWMKKPIYTEWETI